MGETRGEWQARKKAQADIVLSRHRDIKLEHWQDYGTRFVLVHGDPHVSRVLMIGQLAREETGQELIDLSNAEIDAWVNDGPPR